VATSTLLCKISNFKIFSTLSNYAEYLTMKHVNAYYRLRWPQAQHHDSQTHWWDLMDTLGYKRKDRSSRQWRSHQFGEAYRPPYLPADEHPSRCRGLPSMIC
jgi:hypothetical protein